MDWPRYMVDKRLKSGAVAYYWRALKEDTAAGFSIAPEALGQDFTKAKARADFLNTHLDAWREGRELPPEKRHLPGTLAWLVTTYQNPECVAWQRVSDRARPDYTRALDIVINYVRKSGRTLGAAALSDIDAVVVDKLYTKLKTGPKGPRLRQANLCIIRTARAWDVVARLYPKLVPALNPFRGVQMTHGTATAHASSREEAYALHKALVDADEPHLAAAPLICFEWLQRPENLLGGKIGWGDYGRQRGTVRVEHHKTGRIVDLPLRDADGDLFPELMDYLDGLERLGIPIVMARPRRGRPADGKKPLRHPPRLFKFDNARARVRKAARAAGLPDHISLASCRHGGMTELGDSEVTEQGVMALSGHVTPEASRLYVKKTARQRQQAARKRRNWVDLNGAEEQNSAETRNGDLIETRNEKLVRP